MKDALVVRPTHEKIVKIALSDSNLRYTTLGLINPESIIQRSLSIWSGLLQAKDDAGFMVFESKLLKGEPMDGRHPKDRFIELCGLASIIRIIARETNLPAQISIAVGDQLYPYIPRQSSLVGGQVWVASSEIYELARLHLGDLLPPLDRIPRSDLPIGVGSYSMESASIKALLDPFILTSETRQRFVIVNHFMGYLENGNIPTLKMVIDSNDMKDMIDLEENGTTIIVRGSKRVKSGEGETKDYPSYESLMIFFIYLKATLKKALFYEFLFSSAVSIKLVKNSLWTTLTIMKAMVKSGLFNESNAAQKKQIGDYQLFKYDLSPAGLEQIVEIFGEQIVQSEFIVRPSRKAEIISTSGETLDIVENALTENRELFMIHQRTLTSISFEAIRPKTPYLDLMRVYFIVKFLRGVALISEMNPQKQVVGMDALDSISRNTDFGGGISMIHLMTVKKEGKNQTFLIGDGNAIDALLGPLPKSIKAEIQVKEIEPGVVGRHITNRVYSYVHFMLD